MVLILALSMLIGVFYYVLIFFSPKAYAAESDVVDDESWNINLRVGICYDEYITVSVRLTAEHGFDVVYSTMGRNTINLGYLSQTDVHVARHVNLKYASSKYQKASSASETKVGSYHIDVLSDENYLADIEEIKSVFPEYNVFPAYLHAERHVFIGQFATEEEATEALAKIKEALTPPPPPETEPAPETTPEQTEGETTPEISDTTGSTSPDETTKSDTTAEDTTVDTTDTSETTSADEVTTPETTTSEDTTVPEDTTIEDTTIEDTTAPEVIEPPFVSPLSEELTEAVLSSSVRAPLNNDMIVIDPSNHNIIWLHGSPQTYVLLGLGAHRIDPDVNVTMRMKHKSNSGETTRTYDGYMEFSHHCPTEYYGIEIVNLVRLENYIAGVCAAEIHTWWPLETLKAFSIAVRSFSIKRLNGHGGFAGDLCNEACCQVFNGYGPTDERVWRAVLETRGIIATSNGVLCGTYYSSSTGGCTANCTDVWGSSLATYPYLKAVATPWEKYETYSRGQKTYTVTGTALYNRLVDKGYKNLKGPVTDIKITKTGNNTTYVTEIKFYDANGNCQTVNRADKIKKLLSSYVDSANFVVTKSGQSVDRVKYTMLGFGATNPNPPEGLDVLGNPYLSTVTGRQQFSVITANGIKTFYDGQGEKVMTGSGLKDFDMSFALDSQIYPTIIGINGEVLPDISKLSPIIESETLTTTAAANSFTFISRGWGHGVGMSQYGIYELGNLGYDYRYILKAYYSGINYTTYKEYLGK